MRKSNTVNFYVLRRLLLSIHHFTAFKSHFGEKESEELILKVFLHISISMRRHKNFHIVDFKKVMKLCHKTIGKINKKKMQVYKID